MNNFNFDENTINKLKNMMNNGELNKVISQIPPDMMKNFSSIMKNNSTSNKNVENSSDRPLVHSSISSNSSDDSKFNFNNIDINTILKIKSVMENLNTNNDPRSNLLNSLKPYLRDSRKEKIDQYANLLNFAKIAELLKNDNKEKPDV